MAIDSPSLPPISKVALLRHGRCEKDVANAGTLFCTLTVWHLIFQNSHAHTRTRMKTLWEFVNEITLLCIAKDSFDESEHWTLHDTNVYIASYEQRAFLGAEVDGVSKWPCLVVASTACMRFKERNVPRNPNAVRSPTCLVVHNRIIHGLRVLRYVH